MRSAASCCQPRHESSRPRGARTGRGPDVIGEDSNSGGGRWRGLPVASMAVSTLAALETVARGGAPPAARRRRARADRPRTRDGRAARRLGRCRLRPDHGLRQPRERADRPGGRARAAAQPVRSHAVGAGEPLDARDGARHALPALRVAAARPLGRARRARRAAAARCSTRDVVPVIPSQGLGRQLGRPRAARPPRARADRRGRGVVRGRAHAGRPTRCGAPASSPSSWPRRRASR